MGLCVHIDHKLSYRYYIKRVLYVANVATMYSFVFITGRYYLVMGMSATFNYAH
jgi:hypothetical protein